MLLKRHIPLLIVIGVGLFTLFGHFINNPTIQNFVDNDATQWFDIIASFAVFLGALNMLKLQLIKIIRKKNNWQYSILAVLGFAFAIFAGFFYRGANYISISDISEKNIPEVSKIIWGNTQKSTPSLIENKIINSLENRGYEIDTVFINNSSAHKFMGTVEILVNQYKVEAHADSGYHIIINDMSEENIPQVSGMIWKNTATVSLMSCWSAMKRLLFPPNQREYTGEFRRLW